MERESDFTNVCRKVDPRFLNKVSDDRLSLEGSTGVAQVIKLDAVIQNKDGELKSLPLEGRHLVVLSRNRIYSGKAEHPYLPYSSCP